MGTYSSKAAVVLGLGPRGTPGLGSRRYQGSATREDPAVGSSEHRSATMKLKSVKHRGRDLVWGRETDAVCPQVWSRVWTEIMLGRELVRVWDQIGFRIWDQLKTGGLG